MPVVKKQVRKEKWHRSLMEMDEGAEEEEEQEEEVEMKWVDGTNCASCRKTKTKTPGLRHSGVSDFTLNEFSSVTSPLNFPPDV